MIPKSLLMKIIVLLILCLTSSFSTDFINSVLKSKKGDWLYFKGGGYKLVCKPYGVYTINNFLNDEKVAKECKKELIKIRPNIKRRYSKALHQKLHLELTYHIRSIDGKCVVYFNDNKTYAQLIVQNGLGIVKRGFKSKNNWYNHTLSEAQKYAKREKSGIWSTPFISTCFESVK